MGCRFLQMGLFLFSLCKSENSVINRNLKNKNNIFSLHLKEKVVVN